MPDGGKCLTESTLNDFMGAVVRISIMRQKTEGGKPETDLPKCLQFLIEDFILPLTPGFDSFDSERALPTPFTSAAVRQKLTIHESNLKKLFRKWATSEGSAQTMSLHEWHEMFAASGLTTGDLTETKLTEAFVHAMLGDHEGAYEEWEEAGKSASVELSFPEFVEAIMRAGLYKFEADERTPIDLKVHEICLLLICGPAGFQAAQVTRTVDKLSLSAQERRGL